MPRIPAYGSIGLAEYSELGLKVGLEVHQQLLTAKKLFCRCPAGLYTREHDGTVLRHMRPTLSELGEYDGTALMEFKTRKEIIYRIHSDTVCTYEMDDTPPFMLNEEALDIAIEMALLLRLNRVGELHIARKQYLDGSIPTGFQRTTILGVDGWIPYKGRRIRIAQLGLEEDSCREVSDRGHTRVYLTDRLGIPLIETVTYPDMKTPREAAEVGQILRRLARATGKMRTGHGAARQDVNVSVRGGTRIEIKGVPSLNAIPLLVYNEVLRQCALLRIREKLRERGITPATFRYGIHDVTRTLSRTRYTPIRRALDEGMQVGCTLLSGFSGILKETTQTDTNFAKEISDRIRVIACLTRLPNMVHSDSASEMLSASDWKQIRRGTRAGEGDALVLTWGEEADVICACEEIAVRAKEAAEGVPRETRQALRDGTTGFERILPGPNRMYPDTDLPPIAVTEERVSRIRASLPEPPWRVEARYAAFNLPPDVLEELLASPRRALFDRLVKKLEVPPVLAGEMLFRFARALARRGRRLDALEDEEISRVFEAYREGRLAREGINKVLSFLAPPAGSPPPPSPAAADRVEAAIDTLGLRPVEEERLHALVHEALLRSGRGRFPSPEARFRHVMGILMTDLRGCVEGRRLAALVAEALGEGGEERKKP